MTRGESLSTGGRVGSLVAIAVRVFVDTFLKAFRIIKEVMFFFKSGR